MNTIQAQWEFFSRHSIPKNAPPMQIQEMRRAFFAGAAGMLGINYLVAEMSEDAGVQVLEGVRLELDAFGADVLNGRA